MAQLLASSTAGGKHIDASYNVVQYASINAAITALGSMQTTLTVSEPCTLTGNLTVPANITINFLPGGYIIKASTYTITINGKLKAGVHQIFVGFSLGDITFGPGSVWSVKPEWWQENATPGSTDMTAALNCASLAGIGKVIKHRGIYGISDTYYGYKNTKYLGIGSTVSSGDEHPVPGRGSALKWIGTIPVTAKAMFDMKGCYDTEVSGIDFDGYPGYSGVMGAPVTKLVGIHLWADNAISGGSKCVISDFRMIALDQGIVLGGMDPAVTPSDMSDQTKIENFRMYYVNRGILINGWNACQGVNINNGQLLYWYQGAYFIKASLVEIRNVYGGNYSPKSAGSGTFVFEVVSEITIINCQAEPAVIASGADYFARFTTGYTQNAVHIKGCVLDGGMCFDAGCINGQVVISEGNRYTDHVLIYGNTIYFHSKGDYFANVGTSSYATIQDLSAPSSANRIIEEFPTYHYLLSTAPALAEPYNTGTAQFMRRERYNKALYKYEEFSDIANEILPDGNGNPSVYGKKYLKTSNTGPTTYTGFANGYIGQEIIIYVQDNNSTFDFSGTTIRGNGGVDKTCVNGDMIRAVNIGSGYWMCSVITWS